MRPTITILALFLCSLVGASETITLKVIPTFHTPLIIEIKEAENGGTISVTRYAGKGGYEWGSIDIKYEKKLDQLDLKIIREKLDEISFWKMPEKTDVIGLDGSVWMLTVKEEKREHTVKRWTPQSDTEERKLEGFVAFGLYLSDICGIHPIYGNETKSEPGAGGNG
ncbi:MAG: hypothetical protein AAF546_11210 [Verrucomicrobiota bacterium]